MHAVTAFLADSSDDGFLGVSFHCSFPPYVSATEHRTASNPLFSHECVCVRDGCVRRVSGLNRRRI